MDRCVASAENPAVNPVNPVNRGNPVGALRIAIVGAGVSGLVAAAELHRAGHEVTVFEAGSYAGGHTNTIEVEEPSPAATSTSTPASSSSTTATTPTSSASWPSSGSRPSRRT